MQISRRKSLAGVAALTSALLLNACAGGPGSGGSDTVSGKVEGRVTFQTWNLRANFRDYFEGLIAEFQKKYPDARVKWIDQPAEGYAVKIGADAAGGTLPDVVNVSPDLAYPLARAGLAVDLAKAAGKFRGEYLDGAWRSNRMPGMPGVYAFPWYLNTGPMFYNKELFRRAGLDPDKPPKTYDQLFRDALSMAKKSGRGTAMLASTPAIEDFGRYGVRLMNAQGTGFTFNEPRGVALVRHYRELYTAGALDSQALTANAESAGRKFQQQSVAMNPGSALDLQKFQKDAPDLYRHIGITDAVNNTGRANMYVQGLLVNAQSRVKPAALAFAHFVTDEKHQMAFAKQVAIFPSTKGSLNDPYFTREDGTDATRVRVAAARSLGTAVNYTPALLSDQMKTVLRNAVARAVQGRQSPKAALDGAVAECDRLLRTG